ncbi:hypothetical protein [Helicobacter sp. 10-6591]|nr:hypothetical protein [Helicobacter sp. 10-6591]
MLNFDFSKLQEKDFKEDSVREFIHCATFETIRLFAPKDSKQSQKKTLG